MISPRGCQPPVWGTGPIHSGKPERNIVHSQFIVNSNLKSSYRIKKCSTCMKLSLVAIPSCLSKLIKELAFSLSSSLLSSDRMITLLNISGRKCLGALISLTPLTASFAFPLFRYSVTTVSVSLSSSSFDGGGFLLVLAGFSWISGGLVLRPS